MRWDFVIAVFVMVAIAGGFLLRPLWNGTRRSAFAVALFVPLVAVLLYAQIGTPLALDPERLHAPPTLDQEIDALAMRMRQHPDSLDGWVLLARSRKQQERYTEAMGAYAQALKLAPNDPGLMVEMAETMTLDDPQHRILGDALHLLKQAQSVDPRNQRALWFLGIAAYQRGQFAEAATTWEPLLTLAPAATRSPLLKQINMARARAGMPLLAEEAPTASGPALLNVRVDLSPALRAKLAPTDLLFVYARATDGPPMPLAVKRVPAQNFPIAVALADADGPMPTMRLSQQTQVSVQARVSHSGDALPQSGDFEAAPVPATVGAKDTLALTIDRIHP